ncbi:hypothetical protein PG997_003203 [Apiospora hydei]|uniref:Rhodopsin domain-containing protein n=1 Tax=Apiospora hydei TaxID=1337664 RepID=A0ABR1WYL9_9PEZI
MAPRTLGFDVNPAGTRLFIVQMVALALASLACYLRVYVRAFMVRKMLMEDWMMLTATLIYTPTSIIILHSIVLGGTGLHTTQLTQQGIITALRAWYLGEVLYVPTATLIRTSIAFFLLRIAVKSWHVWITRINIVVILVLNIGYFFRREHCTPPSFFWEGPAKVPGAHGSCINKAIVPISTIFHSVLSAISDWTLALLPIAMLWDVQINLRTKISVAMLLGTGLVDVATWSVLEPALGIVAGCIATLRPLFKNLGLSALKRSRKYSSNNNNKKQSHSGGSSTGAGSGGASRRMTRPSNGVNYNNRNMLRLDDMDDDEEDLVADDDRNRGELDLELAPTNKTKTGTTTTTVAAGPESSTGSTTTKTYRPDKRGSEATLNEPQHSPTFLSNRSNSSGIYDHMDAFGDSRDQHWQIESLRPPPQARRNREHNVEPNSAATDGGINVQTTFDLHSLSSSSLPRDHHHLQQQHSVTAFSAEPTGSNTSSSSRDLPLQGTTTWSLRRRHRLHRR